MLSLLLSMSLVKTAKGSKSVDVKKLLKRALKLQRHVDDANMGNLWWVVKKSLAVFQEEF